MSRSSRNYSSEAARQRFKAMRREMREQGDDTFESMNHSRFDDCHCNCEPDVVPPRPIRILGWILAAGIFLGAMVFLGLRAGWQAPVMLCLCLGVVMLPTTIEFLCRGNTVLKRDRFTFFWWW